MTDEPPRIVFFGPDVKTEVASENFGNKASGTYADVGSWHPGTSGVCPVG